ncbi:MAG: translation initiation factor IF-2 N-terminal domain-containing protein, partial [Treponema sp.]|nr:translation initiation factor IF-2 N-terminal domain-containing protein [Treponema sp.]
MAAESDNLPKPKAELIKKAQTDHETPDKVSSGKPVDGTPAGSPPAAAAERQERRKVIVVKKKPVPAPAAVVPPAAAVKKVQPKVIAAKPAEPEIPVQEIKAPVPEPVQEKAAEAPAVQETKPVQKAPVTREEVPFTFTQRPAAAAGKVGGKFVGPRPPRPPFVPPAGRPPFAGGNTGRPTEARDDENRPPRPRDNENRPWAHGPGRPPMAPGANRPGFHPGPGGPRPFGPRPGGPRPAGGSRVLPQGTAPLPEGKTPGKKTFKAKKPVYTRKEKELEMEEKLLQTKKKITQVANPIPKTIEIMEVISVSELARKMNLKASNVIQKLMSMGMMVTINQQIDAETASILASEYGTEVKIVSLYDETVIETASDDGAVLAP